MNVKKGRGDSLAEDDLTFGATHFSGVLERRDVDSLIEDEAASGYNQRDPARRSTMRKSNAELHVEVIERLSINSPPPPIREEDILTFAGPEAAEPAKASLIR